MGKTDLKRKGGEQTMAYFYGSVWPLCFCVISAFVSLFIFFRSSRQYRRPETAKLFNSHYRRRMKVIVGAFLVCSVVLVLTRSDGTRSVGCKDIQALPQGYSDVKMHDWMFSYLGKVADSRYLFINVFHDKNEECTELVARFVSTYLLQDLLNVSYFPPNVCVGHKPSNSSDCHIIDSSLWKYRLRWEGWIEVDTSKGDRFMVFRTYDELPEAVQHRVAISFTLFVCSVVGMVFSSFFMMFGARRLADYRSSDTWDEFLVTSRNTNKAEEELEKDLLEEQEEYLGNGVSATLSFLIIKSLFSLHVLPLKCIVCKGSASEWVDFQKRTQASNGAVTSITYSFKFEYSIGKRQKSIELSSGNLEKLVETSVRMWIKIKLAKGEPFRTSAENASVSDTIRDPYEVLQCSSADSKHDIKRSWKRLVLQYHPDKALKDQKEEFRKKFMDVQNAYNQLRASWDKTANLL